MICLLIHLKEGYVKVNQKPVKSNYRLSFGDSVEVTLPEAKEPDIVPENIPLDILYEDQDIIMINKPKQMVVHPAPGHYSGTLVNAIRQDEVTDNIHSVYVDQWHWEKIMSPEERNLDFLKSTVKDIYEALKNTEKHMADQYDYIETILPDEIFFITSQELEDHYPNLTPKEREYTITKEKGAVFIMQIGGVLASGERQDGRSPDYDDWSLNGDLIVYYPVLDIALELSSMGIRVNADALRAQLKECGCQSRAKLPFQKSILNGTLPQTIGGGIGQSRICMFFLRKAHIGEVQCSVWSMETREVMDVMNIQLL